MTSVCPRPYIICATHLQAHVMQHGQHFWERRSFGVPTETWSLGTTTFLNSTRSSVYKSPSKTKQHSMNSNASMKMHDMPCHVCSKAKCRNNDQASLTAYQNSGCQSAQFTAIDRDNMLRIQRRKIIQSSIKITVSCRPKLSFSGGVVCNILSL